MCDDAFGWWLRLGLNVTSGALFGFAWGTFRRARRRLDEAAEIRRIVGQNLVRSEQVMARLEAWRL